MKYYEMHPDQLSEKFKDQYDCDYGDYLFIVFIVLASICAFII